MKHESNTVWTAAPQIRAVNKNSLQLDDTIPGGTYTVRCDINGFFLEPIDNFTLPEQIFGNVKLDVERIITTFEDRPGRNTGCLLEGLKGSGKSLLAKLCAVEMLNRGYPVINIDTDWTDNPEYVGFLAQITQRSMVLFDEFEKVHAKESQEALLSLFDGANSIDTLFILTVNEEYKVTHFMDNRPGRIYYKFDFAPLEEDVMVAFCRAKSVSEEDITQYKVVMKIYSEFSFDMLVACVEECARYNMKPRDALLRMNVRPTVSRGKFYKLTKITTREGTNIKFSSNDSSSHSPYTSSVGFDFTPSEDSLSVIGEDNAHETWLHCGHESLVGIDAENEVFTYEATVAHWNEPNVIVTVEGFYEKTGGDAWYGAL